MSLLSNLKTGMLVTTREGLTYMVMENPFLDGSVSNTKIALEVGKGQGKSWLILDNDSYTDDLRDQAGEEDYDICVVEDLMANGYTSFGGGNILYFNSDVALRPMEKGYLETALLNFYTDITDIGGTLYFEDDYDEDGIAQNGHKLMEYSLKWLKRLVKQRSIKIQDLLDGVYDKREEILCIDSE